MIRRRVYIYAGISAQIYTPLKGFLVAGRKLHNTYRGYRVYSLLYRKDKN